jgi:hypothetical protein
MAESSDTHVKILFRYLSPVFDDWMVETMWAEIIDEKNGLYRLDNIPFYGPPVASDDIVYAEYDEDEERLTYRKTVEYSGNSIVTVVIMNDETDSNWITNIFSDLDCLYEGVKHRYFSLEIRADKNYALIKRKLEELSKNGVIDYSEPCLSDIHRSQI